MIGDAEIETLIVAEEVAVIHGISHFGGPRAKACVQFDHCAECVANGRGGDEGGAPGLAIAGEDTVAEGWFSGESRVSR